mmetsp:Transcript_23207/g.50450  ORF Transcript_23207/g.50450 Transcript_23207/m.50450 type:complete len:104 (+) Transcript_23207:664-975(+)
MILDHPSCFVDMVDLDEDRGTALHLLCQSRRDSEHAVVKMKILLECGANPTERDGLGDTPFYYLTARIGHSITEEGVRLATELLAVLQIAIISRRNQQQDEED